VRRLVFTFFAAFFLLFPGAILKAQDAAPAHAPDLRAQQKPASLDFPPKPNAPFVAIARTLWVRTLPDGSTVTTKNERVVARDMDGRIFQERRTFTPVPDDGIKKSIAYLHEYTDPVAHTFYSCYPGSKYCDLENYSEPPNQPDVPAGLQPDGVSYLTRENLDADNIEGIKVQHTREAFTIFKQKIGNTKTILRVVDYWYSPALSINVKVVRHDPRDGDQTLWLTNIKTTAADPSTFKPPAGYRILDRRASKPISSPPATAP
jgi:hypothetical protein